MIYSHMKTNAIDIKTISWSIVDSDADVKSDVKTTSRDKTLDLDVKSLTAEERVELGRLITKIRRGTDSGDVGGEG